MDVINHIMWALGNMAVHPGRLLVFFFFHPLFFKLAFLSPFFALLWLAKLTKKPSLAASCGHYIFGCISALMILIYLFSIRNYLFSHAFSDHIEPDIASVSWFFWNGNAVYHNLVTQERYSLLYGPYLYVFIGFFQTMLGPNIFATKLPCALAATMALLLLFIAICRKSTWRRALCLTGLAAALLLSFGFFSFWARSDPFILLAVALGVFATTQKGWLCPLLLGLSLGVAVNLKVHSLVYFLPLFLLAWRQKPSVAEIFACLSIAFVTMALPFVVFDNISLVNYFALLKMASHHGFGAWICLNNLGRFSMLILPAVIGMTFERMCVKNENLYSFKFQCSYFVAILLAFLLILPPASKFGSGPHHLIPFIPIIAFMGAFYLMPVPLLRSYSSKPMGIILMLALAWWVSSSIFNGIIGGYDTNLFVRRNEDQARRCIIDVRRIVRDHPHYTVLAGTGSDDSYGVTFSRCELTFEGMPIGVDPGAMMDFEQSGLGHISLASLIGEIKKNYSAPALWIVPKNSPPFTTRSLYPSRNPVFADAFRTDFVKTYTRTETTEFFDIYSLPEK